MIAQRTLQSKKMLSELRASSDYYDLTIRCGEDEFRVHKCIVCPQSTFFRNACKEQKWKEGDSGIIELKATLERTPDIGNDDPRAVKLMIDYLYLGDYDPGMVLAPDWTTLLHDGEDCERRSPNVPPSEFYQEVCTERLLQTQVETTAALDSGLVPIEKDEWAIPPKRKTKKDVKKEMKKKMVWHEPEPEPEPSLPVEPVADGAINSSFLAIHAKMFAIASKYDIKPLEDMARRKFKDQTKWNWNITDLTAAMEIVFDQTPESEVELRRTLKDLIVEHALTLVQHPGFESAVTQIDGLAYDLFCRKTYSVA